jgi:DNA repair exonuclease SbcCD nuclease subunit
LKPDFCVHTGDLFDSPRPSNRNISLAIEQFSRVVEQGIPIVVIAGNHETPRTRQLGHVLALFDFFPGIHSVHQPRYTVVRLGGVAVHAVPQCPTADHFEAELAKATPASDADHNLLLLHGAIASIPEFSRGDFNEQFIDPATLEEFDWVALGHYHNYAEVAPNAAYSGSTERFSFAEADHRKGFLIVEMEGAKTRFVELPSRDMIEVVIRPSTLASDDLNAEIADLCRKIEPGDKIVKFKVEGFDVSSAESVDFKTFFDLTREAVHSSIEVLPQDSESIAYSPSSHLSRLSDEFQSYLALLPGLKEEERREIEALGLEYLSLAQAADSE